MLNKINNYLLTNYPLLWNSRVIWVIALSLVLHILFFAAGFAEVSASAIKNYYYWSSIASGSVYTFSILCSLAIIIIWLIFYLRNNAFKSFFIIDRFYSVKEFIIIIITIFVSITFYKSYQWGASVKTRIITSQQELVRESNILNLATSFIPVGKADYFILNNCDSDDPRIVQQYNEGTNYNDTNNYQYNDTNWVKIRAALNRKDAFSYKNYCNNLIDLSDYTNFTKRKEWIAIKNNWIDSHATDSIHAVLQQALAISKKYAIDYKLNADIATQLVFADSFHNVTRIYPSSQPYQDNDVEYFSVYELRGVLSFIESVHLNSKGRGIRSEIFLFELYFSVCFSILVLCYRLFSRRVFLISIIGTIVWAIVFVLFGISSRDGMGIGWFYLFLFGLFITTALITLHSGTNKTTTGVLLNWHIYMLPFVIMIIVMLISENYESYHYVNGAYVRMSDEELQQKYPIGFWVSEHTALIFRLNLLFIFLYTAFFFTKLGKKWHIMPAE